MRLIKPQGFCACDEGKKKASQRLAFFFVNYVTKIIF
tara:strand:+ start:4517 stop:4627 length:111 start_codon:yes stop_codon:yes gene_type:complete